ncbi:MAG: flagellar motor protein [Pseudomonadales bacterium]|nr:flagellar motor protein [Pseudomonadales bacterium]
MDALTLVGVVMAIGAILLGNMLEGGHVESLIQMTAFLIVMGGTLGAVMVQTPLKVFIHAWKRALWVVLPPKVAAKETIEKIVEWSQIARKEGLLGLQDIAEEETDAFSKKGLQMLVDGSEPEVIRKVLEIELSIDESRDNNAAKVFEGFGGYSPTIGIIGAVMGLIHVMNNLADPSALGPGIAVAFVATIYGVGLANIFFLPIANKMKTVIGHQVQFREMIIDGLVSLAEGEHPRSIENKLNSYLG